jgi:hypothetical protein
MPDFKYGGYWEDKIAEIMEKMGHSPEKYSPGEVMFLIQHDLRLGYATNAQFKRHIKYAIEGLDEIQKLKDEGKWPV